MPHDIPFEAIMRKASHLIGKVNPIAIVSCISPKIDAYELDKMNIKKDALLIDGIQFKYNEQQHLLLYEFVQHRHEELKKQEHEDALKKVTDYINFLL